MDGSEGWWERERESDGQIAIWGRQQWDNFNTELNPLLKITASAKLSLVNGLSKAYFLAKNKNENKLDSNQLSLLPIVDKCWSSFPTVKIWSQFWDVLWWPFDLSQASSYEVKSSLKIPTKSKYTLIGWIEVPTQPSSGDHNISQQRNCGSRFSIRHSSWVVKEVTCPYRLVWLPHHKRK